MVLTARQLEAIMPDATQLESEEPEMESSSHYTQLALLVMCLEWLWRDRSDYFIGATLSVYFCRRYLRDRDFRSPEFFLVKQVRKRPRKSWVVWEEDGKYPNLIIELLSEETANCDRHFKKELYQDIFRTPEYFWFDPETLEFQGFRLKNNQYREIQPNNRGWRWSEELELYLGVDGGKLRYFTPKGQLVPTPQEAAIQEQLQVQQERQQTQQAQLQAQQAQLQAQRERELAQEERDRADRLAERLRELGIDPDSE